MTTITYGYGHTKEAASLVREALNKALKTEKKNYQLTISVRKADSGYGGPRVHITTPLAELDKRYQYIIDANGQPADSGTLVSRPFHEFPNGSPDCRFAQLVRPAKLIALNDKITKVLSQFGKDDDDIMTDYFDNTMPLFYGVDYKAAK